jgi:hypothetical protein
MGKFNRRKLLLRCYNNYTQKALYPFLYFSLIYLKQEYDALSKRATSSIYHFQQLSSGENGCFGRFRSLGRLHHRSLTGIAIKMTSDWNLGRFRSLGRLHHRSLAGIAIKMTSDWNLGRFRSLGRLHHRSLAGIAIKMTSGFERRGLGGLDHRSLAGLVS